MKVLPFCAGGTRNSGPTHPIFTLDIWLIEILGYMKFRANRQLLSHVMRLLIPCGGEGVPEIVGCVQFEKNRILDML